ncbi:MAG: 50S ribosomal protein L1 [Planctomycetes bacterium]|nr:50S ribosomal protein L1 [Planctomycetota bacterium]
MRYRGKRYKKDIQKVPAGPIALDEAIKRVKSFSKPKFDQSVDLVCHLGIDPKQADQMIRGSVSLPKGIGKTKRVIAFCSEADAEAAKEAGAIEAGADELVQKIQEGWLDFDVAVAHPSLMGKVGKLGRVLGPQGKMPSPKSGTVTPDVATAVREYAAGKVEFRNDNGGNVHAAMGKISFSDDDLKENIVAFIGHIRRMKPSAAKGQYLKRVCLSGTMTPAVTVDTSAGSGLE